MDLNHKSILEMGNRCRGTHEQCTDMCQVKMNVDLVSSFIIILIQSEYKL